MKESGTGFPLNFGVPTLYTIAATSEMYPHISSEAPASRGTGAQGTEGSFQGALGSLTQHQPCIPVTVLECNIIPLSCSPKTKIPSVSFSKYF